MDTNGNIAVHLLAAIGLGIVHIVFVGLSMVIGAMVHYGGAVANLNTTLHGLKSHTALIDGSPAHGHVIVADIGGVSTLGIVTADRPHNIHDERASPGR